MHFPVAAILTGWICFGAFFCHAQQLAFPGAEGFGRFTTGGRGGSVYEVTNLNDSGPGSLRAAIEARGARTVVFRVSGTIALQSPLDIENGDLTIAGQTAPGDGICIRDYPLNIFADNIILRYIRVRLGDVHKLSEDATSAYFQKDIIIDHCSFSWGIDEVLTVRDNINSTVQWCIISESLHDSWHEKGKHGYGGIWGGMGASFHHNLIAHHTSRNPRFNGSRYHKQPDKEIVDFRNNVIYNWGFNSAYGGEGGQQNVVANYYKYGPASKHKDRIVEPWDGKGKWFVSDNVVFGYPNITADNWSGGVQGDFQDQVRVAEPHPFAPVATQTAVEAFERVLANAGAILPKRDSLDSRIVREVKSGTATYGGVWGAGSGIIDSQTQVGGWPTLRSVSAPPDGDHDGMPDAWELSNRLNPADPEDRNGDRNSDGYTNLEEYLNSLTVQPAPQPSAIPETGHADIIVDQNGQGDFSTITEAIAALPMFAYQRVIIFVRNGVYEEKLRIEQNYVTLRGESRDSTIIHYSVLRSDWDAGKDALGPAVLNISGDDVVLDNLTVENTQPEIGPHAFAIFGTGTRTILSNCNVISKGGDTVSLWRYKDGMYYHANCYFEGAVDFVCPRGWCFIRDSKFYQVKKTATLWHDGHYDPAQKIVIVNAEFDGVAGFSLGRHHYEAQFYLIDCRFSVNMADRPFYRHTYDDPAKNNPYFFGDRYYFHNCSKPGRAFPWYADNLNTAPGSPAAAEITPAWTFDGRWNPESKQPLTVTGYAIADNTVTLTFNEIVSVRGEPRFRNLTGKEFRIVRQRFTDINKLKFVAAEAITADDLAGELLLLEGDIIASVAGIYERSIGSTFQLPDQTKKNFGARQ